jgi:ubiquinol-cytochrome c reductase cytochrome b subunit
MNLRRPPGTRAVPLQWTMLIGAVSLACFFVLTVTGVAMLFYFDPSGDTIRFHGSYPLLEGVPVSHAYASTVHLSLDVRGGLLIRQTHHWAALVLPASLTLQLLSTFFTGGFRRPRQWSWVLLVLTFILALAGGWSGYGLPDDELAGTGLRIAQGILVGIPLVGTRAQFVLLGGEFPGHVIERMYWLHVAIVPALVVLVLTARLRLALRRKPAQFPGRGRTETRIVGLPLAAVAVRATGLFVITTGVLVLLGGLCTINPLWIYGPSATEHASAGSQPDWYTGWLDGALRLTPSGWDVSVFGGTLPLGILIPQALAGGFLSIILLWPFLEARVTMDRRNHHLLDRPREHPTRTGFGVAGIVFFIVLWAAGSTDIVTTQLNIAFENVVAGLQTALIVGPLVAFHVTRSVCQALTAHGHDVAANGVETGRIVRSADGGYSELHQPLDEDHYALVEHLDIERRLRERERARIRRGWVA